MEVYPAACLKRLGLLYRGYERAADLTELGWLLDR